MDSSSFHSLLSTIYEKSDCIEENNDDETIIDHSMEEKGIIVVFRDSQYKKKVKLIVSPSAIWGNEERKYHKLVNKLERVVKRYFNHEYQLLDFNLTAVNLTATIDVGTSEMVSKYIRVLQRIGKVKGFSPVCYEGISEKDSYCLEGNSNCVSFKLYDLQKFLVNLYGENSSNTVRGRIDKVMEAFESIGLSPITISKRDTTENLRSLYSYFEK